MATEFCNELNFAGDREDLALIREYVSTIARADEDKPRYDLAVTETDGVVHVIDEPPIPLVSDVQFATQGARLTCYVNSRHKPCLDLTSEISQRYPAVAVGHTFWAEWGVRHGYRVLVAGETKDLEDGRGVESPEEDETGELADAAAAKIQERYRRAVDALLTDFETSAVLAATVANHDATRAAITGHAKADRELSEGGGHGHCYREHVDERRSTG